MTGWDSRSQRDQRKFNPNTVAQDIHKKVAKYGHYGCLAIFCHFFVNILGYGIRIEFLLVTLWSWVLAGHFAYIKPNKYNNLFFEFFAINIEKKKPVFAFPQLGFSLKKISMMQNVLYLWELYETFWKKWKSEICMLTAHPSRHYIGETLLMQSNQSTILLPPSLAPCLESK